MRIDWITVAAQLANFLILVWLLKRFLYRPVIDAMARREQRIRERLEQAASREQEAETTADDYRRRTRALDDERSERLQELRQEVDDERRNLLERAREEVDRQREQWREDLTRERRDIDRALRRRLAEAATQAARRALTDLAETSLESRIVATFLRRLAGLDEGRRSTLAAAADSLRVVSAFELDEATRHDIESRLEELLGRKARPVYAREPELLCGIELHAADLVVDWSVADFLEGLEQRLDTALGEHAGHGESSP